MFHEMSGLGYNFGMLPYGDTWRTSRRMVARYLGTSKAAVINNRETKYVRQLLLKLLDKPDEFLSHIHYCFGAHGISMTYGLEVQSTNDPYLKGIDRAFRIASESITAGAFIVDAFPFLKHLPKWFPGTQFHVVASKLRESVPFVRDLPFAAAENAKLKGNIEESFVSEALEDLDTSENAGDDIELIMDVASELLMGDMTTVSSAQTFMLAMVLHPEAQKKAQAELDACLHGRLPEHSDVQGLPYLSAVMSEVLRWRCVLPIAAPHATTSADTVNGYSIPEGAIILPNIWAMSMDPTVYPDPERFIPERHLKNGQLNTSVRNPCDFVFGFGRRRCPGYELAQSMMKLAFASILSTFDLSKQVGSDGNEITPPGSYFKAPVMFPSDFACRILPRSTEAIQLIREHMRTANI